MKVAAIAVGGFLLLIAGLFGMGNTMLTSAPFASDAQREMYEQVVEEYRLAIPGSVLLAVDTVRFRQDFSRVDRDTVRHTAELFSACADFEPLIHEVQGGSGSVPFRVPRTGEMKYSVLSPTRGAVVTARVVDDQGRVYESPSTVAGGEYWVEVEVPNPPIRWRVRLYLDMEPCGEAEISAVLDRLGLVGDDRAMVYHLIAMYLPEQERFGRIAPGPYGWPVDDDWPITSPFGSRLDPVTGEWRVHTGVDIGASTGTKVGAATDGTVTYAGWDGNYGNVVRVAHGDGVVTAYGHLKTVLVSVGQRVVKWQAVGLVGSTGKSTGPHLHFEWWVNGEAIDPLTVYRWVEEEKP